MTKAAWEIRDLIKDALHSECPNCGGYLVQHRDDRLRCQDCGYDIVGTSKDWRIGWLVATVGALIFAVGFLVAVVVMVA